MEEGAVPCDVYGSVFAFFCPFPEEARKEARKNKPLGVL